MGNKYSTTNSGEFGRVSIIVKNIGGIDHSELNLKPGISVLSGRNATNRTSLLSALGGVLGGTTASLKSDADEGHISLEFDGGKYIKEYERKSNGIQITGSSYSDQTEIIDLCVMLLENNPARKAVKNDGNLREIIMRPVDTEKIESKITELKKKKQSIKTETQKYRNQQSKLSNLKHTRAQLKDKIDTLNDELNELQAEVIDFEEDVEEAEKADEIIDELKRNRKNLDKFNDEIDVKKSERDALHADIEEIEDEIEKLSTESIDKQNLNNEISKMQNQKNTIESTIASLTTIIDFNNDVLNEKSNVTGIEPRNTDITSGLAPKAEQEIACWTCGSQVRRNDIIQKLDDLRNIVSERRDTKQDLVSRISKLQNKRQKYKQVEEQRETSKQQLTTMREKLDSRENEIEELISDRNQVQKNIEKVKEKVVETEELRENNLLEKYDQISSIQYERGQLQQRVKDITDEIDEIEQLTTIESLESELSKLDEELEAQKMKIDKLETNSIEHFNKHMEELLNILKYKNISRIWIEKKKSKEHQSELNSQTEFDLHIIRETDDGVGYEDLIENLSESEREVVGLVVALAGYFVHNVHKEVPFMLLDSLEAIDAQRIANLVEYFSEYIPYLVIALLPEDTTALQSECDQITAAEFTD